MKAIVLERHGPPEVLMERRLPTPEPGADEIRVEVRAAGVNFADLLQRLGLYGSAPRPPYVPGFEVAGEVSAVGAAVERFRPGDRVVALCRFGGYAERVCAAQGQAMHLPEALGFEQGAALPVNYLTAWFCLFEMGHLEAHDSVLVHGGAGGVGIAAVQLAIDRGAEVFATAGSPEKVEFLRRQGVHHPIDYRRQDFAAVVHEHTGGYGVDVVLDPVGGETLKKSYGLLPPLGRVVSYGLSAAVPGPRRNWLKTLSAWWRTPRFDPLEMIGRNTGVFGFHLAHLRGREHLVERAFARILEMTAQGTLRPVIAATFPLGAAGAAAAHRFLHERRNIGKVLLVDERGIDAA